MPTACDYRQEFLHDWLGIELSVGAINNTLHEVGATAMPLEEEFIQNIARSTIAKGCHVFLHFSLCGVKIPFKVVFVVVFVVVL